MNETPAYRPTELDLMLSGDRPCAMFADLVPATYEIPVDAFKKYVDEGIFVMRDVTLPAAGEQPAVRYVYFALKHEAWRIDDLHQINEGVHSGGQAPGPETNLAIGKLLGLSEDDIRAFQEWWDGQQG